VPELPEVETTRRGLLAVLPGRVVRGLEVTEGRLRAPISPALARRLEGRTVTAYLLTASSHYFLLFLPSLSLSTLFLQIVITR
jgi:formamidopyrimidine-DNA glycosylase